METNNQNTRQALAPIGSDFFERLWKEGSTYVKTVVDVMQEPILILDKNLCVLAANESFYKTFEVVPKDTERTLVYELGNGQWNIPELRKLLEDILPKKTFFKGFEVAYEFPSIGARIMLLNGRQIHLKESEALKIPIILLAMTDVTEMMVVADTMADHANELEKRLAECTQKLEAHIRKLEKDNEELRKKL